MSGGRTAAIHVMPAGIGAWGVLIEGEGPPTCRYDSISAAFIVAGQRARLEGVQLLLHTLDGRTVDLTGDLS